MKCIASFDKFEGIMQVDIAKCLCKSTADSELQGNSVLVLTNTHRALGLRVADLIVAIVGLCSDRMMWC